MKIELEIEWIKMFIFSLVTVPTNQTTWKLYYLSSFEVDKEIN